MNEIKYTTDGKKVVVIGNLNSQEKIVQEIFIINDQEIPSGQNFVVKDLHNAPAISWKEKRLKEIEERYIKESNQMLDGLQKLRERHEVVCKEFRNKIEYISKANTNLKPEVFELLTDYITGRIEYILITGYSIEIKDIKDFNQNYEGNLRLISFFGKDDGSFTYAIGDYHDYSGGNRKFIPCRTKQEAVDLAKDILLNKKEYNEYDLNFAEKHNILLDNEKVNIFKSKRISEYNSNIESYNKKILEWQNEIKKYNN